MLKEKLKLKKLEEACSTIGGRPVHVESQILAWIYLKFYYFLTFEDCWFLELWIATDVPIESGCWWDPHLYFMADIHDIEKVVTD